MALFEQIQQFQSGSVRVTSVTKTVIPGTVPNPTSKLPNKLTETISQLTSKSNEISSFLNNSSINSGNQPFSLSKFAREFITKQSTTDEGQTSQVTNSQPITRKVNQISQKVVDQIVQNFLKSEKLITLLENQVDTLLKQNINNQSQQVDLTINNIQQIVTTYTTSIDKYARRIYNTDPIKTTDDLKNNLSLNHIIEFINTVISIALLLLQIKIKVRKALDLAAAANAAAQVPVPNVALATKLTQQALQNTASEQKQLDDLASTQERISSIKKKITFYGRKYEKAKTSLSTVKEKIDNYKNNLTRNSFQILDNKLNESTNKLTNIK